MPINSQHLAIDSIPYLGVNEAIDKTQLGQEAKDILLETFSIFEKTLREPSVHLPQSADQSLLHS